MAKQAISVTLEADNLTWLKGRAGAAGLRSVSELLDQLVSAARAAGRTGPARSVVGTIDIAAGISFSIVALRANRIYPICLAGFQLAAIASHFLKSLAPTINGQAYGILIAGPSYLQTAIFLLGLSLHIRRQRRLGPYRSWQAS